MKKLLGIVVLFLLWCGNLYANQYDDFFDMFNKCLIKENKYQDTSYQTKDGYYYKFCNLEFGEKRKFNTEIGTLIRWKTKRFSYVQDLKADEEKSRLFEILTFNINLLRAASLDMRIFANEENNSIGVMTIHKDWLYIINNLMGVTSHHVVKKVDVDLCQDIILKHADILSEKYLLKKKNWKKSSEIYKSKKNSYPNGNPIIMYRKGLVYKLPDNKEINLACDYRPEVSTKSIIWNVNIEYADSDFLTFLKKNWKKYPKLNLKIIWKKINAELYS